MPLVLLCSTDKGDIFFIRDKNLNITYHEIKPKEGSLIIMPIHIFHGAYPQAKGLRQTLNMDFEIEKLC